MTMKEIRELPTSVDNVHESVLRAYQIVRIVKRWLSDEPVFSPKLLLELIEDMESAPHKALTIGGAKS